MNTDWHQVLAGEARWSVTQSDCLAALAEMPDGCIDAVVSDPPYPEIDRDYGRMTEPEWHAMMDAVVAESRRVLSPRGSAVFILQPNSERVGSMRPWLWEFVARWAREWNLVQDCYWWNHTTPPSVHSHRTRGLLRPSVKTCVWLGPADCYRNQDGVLWTQSLANAAVDIEDRALRYFPSGAHLVRGRTAAAAVERGGVTPFNLIPIANANSVTSGGAHGHGAATPMPLCRWWVRYLCPRGGAVLDPFVGSGTVIGAALLDGCRGIGIERDPGLCSNGADSRCWLGRPGLLATDAARREHRPTRQAAQPRGATMIPELLCIAVLETPGAVSQRIPRDLAFATCMDVAHTAEARGVDPSLAVAVAHTEGKFNDSLRGPSGLGTMQVLKANHRRHCSIRPRWGMFAECRPILSGVKVLDECLTKRKTEPRALCRYKGDATVDGTCGYAAFVLRWRAALVKRAKRAEQLELKAAKEGGT